MIRKSRKYYTILFMFTFSVLQAVDNVGFTSFVDGTCQIENLENNRITNQLLGSSILNYDIISSGKNSSCDIMFTDQVTKVHLEENTKIKISTEKFSRIIRLFYGNIYIENAKSEIKTYIQTSHNDIYINDNKIWISTNREYDRLFGIKTFVDIYNHLSKSSIIATPIVHYQIASNGDISFDENLNLIPSYVINENYIYQNKISSSEFPIHLNSYDLIPVYEKRRRPIFNNNGIKYRIASGFRYMDSKSYLSISFSPKFWYYNLKITGNFDVYIDSEKEIFNNWDNGWDLLQKINIDYIYNVDYNRLSVKLGSISKISFGHGYLVNNLSNNFDYPYQRNFGIQINYKLDNDFMKFKFIIPSIEDFVINGEGIIGMHTSLFTSHRFPLTVGLGFIIDFNQFSQADDIYNFSTQSPNIIKREVSAAEFDFNINLVKKMNLDISLYGEFVGIWYPDYIYYEQSEGIMPYDDDKRYRKGTWGIMAPGLSIKLNNRLEMKFALNYNSAAHIPAYFNSNYLYNKSIYYDSNTAITFNSLKFNLLIEQIDMLNEFSINQDGTEFIYPKEIYPIIIPTLFNAFPVFGFTSEFKFNYNDKVDISALSSLFVQQTEVVEAGTYYSVQSIVSIKDNVIKSISFMDFYLSNIFFWGTDDLEGLLFGSKVGFKLPFGMSLIFDVGQVYYDANLSDDKKEMINIGLDFGISF